MLRLAVPLTSDRRGLPLGAIAAGILSLARVRCEAGLQRCAARCGRIRSAEAIPKAASSETGGFGVEAAELDEVSRSAAPQERLGATSVQQVGRMHAGEQD